MPHQARRARRTALALVAGSSLAATLGLAASPAMAATAAHVQNGTLQVSGDGAGGKLALRLAAGDPTTLQVDVGDDGTPDFSFDRSTFRAIDVQAGGGDDQIRVDESNGTFTDAALTIDGGSGNDRITGGSGADTLIGGPGADDVNGGRGADIADLGGGADRFTWNPGDGSDTVEGGAGNDTLAFNGANIAEKFEFSANGSRVRMTRDIANIVMDLNGVEDVALETLGGADTVTVGDLTGTGLQAADINLDANGAGDNAPDTVIATRTLAATVSAANGTTVVSGRGADINVAGTETANDSVQVDAGTVNYLGTQDNDRIGISANGTFARVSSQGGLPVDVQAKNLDVQGLGGNDQLLAGNGLANLTQLTLDGGRGNDLLEGGDGNDLLIGGRGDDFADGNRGTDTALLGSGADTFQWDPGDGSDTVEGQRGSDTLAFNGANIAEKMDVSADGSRVRFTRDIAGIVMDLNGIEHLAVRALGGADTIHVGDLTGTDLRTAAIDLAATGGGGDGAADTVTTDGTDRRDRVDVTRSGNDVLVSGLPVETTISGSEQANDALHVDTLGGRDRVAIAPGVNDLITPIVDLGADN